MSNFYFLWEIKKNHYNPRRRRFSLQSTVSLAAVRDALLFFWFDQYYCYHHQSGKRLFVGGGVRAEEMSCEPEPECIWNDQTLVPISFICPLRGGAHAFLCKFWYKTCQTFFNMHLLYVLFFYCYFFFFTWNLSHLCFIFFILTFWHPDAKRVQSESSVAVTFQAEKVSDHGCTEECWMLGFKKKKKL